MFRSYDTVVQLLAAALRAGARRAGRRLAGSVSAAAAGRSIRRSGSRSWLARISRGVARRHPCRTGFRSIGRGCAGRVIARAAAVSAMTRTASCRARCAGSGSSRAGSARAGISRRVAGRRASLGCAASTALGKSGGCGEPCGKNGCGQHAKQQAVWLHGDLQMKVGEPRRLQFMCQCDCVHRPGRLLAFAGDSPWPFEVRRCAGE